MIWLEPNRQQEKHGGYNCLWLCEPLTRLSLPGKLPRNRLAYYTIYLSSEVEVVVVLLMVDFSPA